jgi:prolyl oligopeptidase
VHTYADTIAVAEDLIHGNVTAAKRVGFVGHSAGGLLGGVMLTQRPDLFGAIVLKGALLDQFRMDLIVSGPAAWVEEFGSPEVPRELAFLKRTSPFQNLKARSSACRPLIITSAADQNVLPGQPRRFAAKMQSLGMPFLFYETEDGGHFFAATPTQRARLDALIYVYLARQLRDPRSESR